MVKVSKWHWKILLQCKKRHEILYPVINPTLYTSDPCRVAKTSYSLKISSRTQIQKNFLNIIQIT